MRFARRRGLLVLLHGEQADRTDRAPALRCCPTDARARQPCNILSLLIVDITCAPAKCVVGLTPLKPPYGHYHLPVPVRRYPRSGAGHHAVLEAPLFIRCFPGPETAGWRHSHLACGLGSHAYLPELLAFSANREAGPTSAGLPPMIRGWRYAGSTTAGTLAAGACATATSRTTSSVKDFEEFRDRLLSRCRACVSGSTPSNQNRGAGGILTISPRH